MIFTNVCRIGRLKPHKNDGGSSLSTDHFVNAGDDCLTHIALLLTAINVHGTAPDCFHLSTIVPIPKGRNVNMADSSNFRGIALSPIFCKIFDNIVLKLYNDKLMSSELQFCFKAKRSTNTCSMILKETIANYNSHQSSVYCSFLDATKAFDKVHYCKLFKLLIKRQLPAHVIRLLINTHTNNFVRVAWCGVMSDYFLAVNGVKQGGVLSPVLFCLYIDDLLIALSSSGVGCYIGINFVGALAYADDLVLIAPTATALRKSFTHLGHVITSTSDDATDIIARRNDFIGHVNNMLRYFRKLSSHVKYRLSRSYCTSFYGCELWSLASSSIEDLCIAWRRGVRLVWNLPPSAHCFILPLICNCLPVFDEICRRSVNFTRACVCT